MPFRFAPANDRRDQPFVDRDRNADVGLVIEANVFVLIRSINKRMLHQGHRGGLYDNVVDADLVVFAASNVDGLSQLERRYPFRSRQSDKTSGPDRSTLLAGWQ